MHRILFILTLAHITTGCSIDEQRERAAMLVDSAGVTIWEFRLENVPERPAAAVELTDGAASMEFGSVTDVLIGEGNVLHIADNGEKRVVNLNISDGTSSSFGRGGEGPGEFTVVGDLLAWPGDSLAVYDWPERRLSIFSGEGGFARRVGVALDADVPGVPLPVGLFGPALLVVEVEHRPASLAEGEGVHESFVEYWTIRTDTGGTSRLVRVRGTRRFVLRVGDGFTARRLPFDADLLSGVGDGLLYVARATPEVHVYDADGDLGEIWRTEDLEQREVSEGDEEEYWRDRITDAVGPQRALEERLAQVVPAAELRSSFDRMAVGTGGEVWLRVTPDGDSVDATWLIVDGSDRQVSRVQLPGQVTVTSVSGGLAAGIAVDALGVTRPVMYAIEGG